LLGGSVGFIVDCSLFSLCWFPLCWAPVARQASKRSLSFSMINSFIVSGILLSAILTKSFLVTCRHGDASRPCLFASSSGLRRSQTFPCFHPFRFSLRFLGPWQLSPDAPLFLPPVSDKSSLCPPPSTPPKFSLGSPRVGRFGSLGCPVRIRRPYLPYQPQDYGRFFSNVPTKAVVKFFRTPEIAYPLPIAFPLFFDSCVSR